MVTRRHVGLIVLAALLLFFTSLDSQGSIARAISLAVLARSSETIVIGTPVEATSRWETWANERRIVTYTRLQIEESLSGGSASELVVRTLGGRVGKIGQVVDGEAVLAVGERAVLFLRTGPDGALRVTAMAQGHYPVRADERGEQRLHPSPRMSELVAEDGSAVKALAGRRVPEAERLIREALHAR